MSIDTDLEPVRGDRGYDRYLTKEAGERRAHEREARLAQLAVIHKVGYHGADPEMTASRTRAILLVLDEIEAATTRLSDGTYGLCQDCWRPIAVERLEILPYARFCIDCQRRRR